MKEEPTKGEIIVYQTDDGRVKLDVRLQDETVWLPQQLIAELFQTTVPNISMHIRNIYEEGELTPEATVKKFLTVRREGNRDLRRELECYRKNKEALGEAETIRQLEEAAKLPGQGKTRSRKTRK